MLQSIIVGAKPYLTILAIELPYYRQIFWAPRLVALLLDYITLTLKLPSGVNWTPHNIPDSCKSEAENGLAEIFQVIKCFDTNIAWVSTLNNF